MGQHLGLAGRKRSLPSNALRVLVHILKRPCLEGKPARITCNGDELRARRDTRPRGNVDRH